VNKIIVGQDSIVEQILIAMLANGHVLIESCPGLGKTKTISTVSNTLGLDFNRIQCTPDLMPADITGTDIIDESLSSGPGFKFRPGPIFSNIIIADEINRTSPKTQSALLESMQEKQVTVGTNTYHLDEPFFVLATQNPIEQEGTYPLPEAQLDRFLLKILVNYPSTTDELEIINRFTKYDIPDVNQIIDKNTLLQLQRLVRDVPIADELKRYVVNIVSKTRSFKECIEYGASPRASIALILASKARALIKGRSYVDEEDIVFMAYPILRHRLVLSYGAYVNGTVPDDVIDMILNEVRVSF
jgi:MoxR-like ATPase